MPRPQWHALVSASTYVLGPAAVRRKRLIASLCNTFVDLDHACDWAYFQATGDREIQLVPLHSWELAAMLVTRRNPTVRMLGVGLLMHLLTDWLVGDYSFARLSVCHRASKRFRTDYLGDWVLWPRGQQAWRSLVFRDRPV